MLKIHLTLPNIKQFLKKCLNMLKEPKNYNLKLRFPGPKCNLLVTLLQSTFYKNLPSIFLYLYILLLLNNF